MRDKFIFDKNPVTSAAHVRRQNEIIKVLTANKASRKILESVAYGQLAKDLKTAAGEETIHSALNKYEKAHLNIGSWPRIKASLKLRWRNLRIEEIERVAELHETIRGVDELLGKIYLDHLRFVPLDPQPLGDAPMIYQRMNDPLVRHYIMLPSTKPSSPNLFVRRFVIRGLNGHNAMELDANKPLTAAHRTRQPDALTGTNGTKQASVLACRTRHEPIIRARTGKSQVPCTSHRTAGSCER
jgi:hypothetical protein